MGNNVTSGGEGNILFIAPSFFGYSLKIERQMMDLGFNVFRYEDRPSTSTLSKIMIRLLPKIASWVSSLYFKKIFMRHKGAKISHLVVLKGEALSGGSVKAFKNLFPEARTVLYLWDSLRNTRVARDSMPEYDSVFTFDIQDYEAVSGLKFMPLFFMPSKLSRGKCPNNCHKDIDLSFVGTAHSDRVAVIERIRAQISKGVITEFFLYMPSVMVFWARRVFDPMFWMVRRSEISFVPLKYEAVQRIIARSKAVLDIERSDQSGLTIRTLEALSQGVKIVTTNSEVKRYAIYDPTNVLVIDRKRPSIVENFFDAPFVPLPAGQIEKYDISAWVKTLLGLQALESYLVQHRPLGR